VPAVTPSAIGSPASACEIQSPAEPARGGQGWDAGREDGISVPPIPVLAVPSRQLVSEGVESQLDWELWGLARNVPKSFETFGSCEKERRAFTEHLGEPWPQMCQAPRGAARRDGDVLLWDVSKSEYFEVCRRENRKRRE